MSESNNIDPEENSRNCFREECGAYAEPGTDSALGQGVKMQKNRCRVNFENYNNQDGLFACEYEDNDLTEVAATSFLTALRLNRASSCWWQQCRSEQVYAQRLRRVF